MYDDVGDILVEQVRERAANVPVGIGGQVVRLLYRTPANRYRLYRSDVVHPDRKKGLCGIRGGIPEEHRGLVDWYYTAYDPHPGY